MILRDISFRRLENYFRIQMRYVLSLIGGRPFTAPYPFAVSAETVRGCNLSCSGCPAGWIATKEIGFMPFSLFSKAVGELSSHAFYLQLWFQGEPLLHKELETFIRFARSKKMVTVIATNGVLLTGEISELLLRNGLCKVIVSADMGGESFHVGGNFAATTENIRRLSDMKRKAGGRLPLVEAQLVVSRENEQYTSVFRNEMKAAGADRVVFKTAWFDDLNNPGLPVPSRYSRYRKNQDGTWQTRKKVRNRCKRIFSTLVITYNGDVVPCCFDKSCRWVLGNVREQNAEEIWRGKAFQAFRQETLIDRKQKEICCNCTE